jgi:hypothetical protein
MWALILINEVVSSSIGISHYFEIVCGFIFWSQTHGVRVGQESAKKAIGFVEV